MANDLGMPDIGLTTLHDVSTKSHQIARVTNLPTIIDIDTGFGEAMNVSRTIETIESLGISGCHIEDQMNPKRCGHLDNKDLVSTQEMVKKIKAAVKAKKDSNFQIIARTDANAVEGLEKTIARAQAYVDAGADIVFPNFRSFPEFIDSSRLYKPFDVQDALTVLNNVLGNTKTHYDIVDRSDLGRQMEGYIIANDFDKEICIWHETEYCKALINSEVKNNQLELEL